jgi:hypothetical protein
VEFVAQRLLWKRSKKHISIYLQKTNEGSKYFLHVSVFLGHLAFDWLHNTGVNVGPKSASPEASFEHPSRQIPGDNVSK